MSIPPNNSSTHDLTAAIATFGALPSRTLAQSRTAFDAIALLSSHLSASDEAKANRPLATVTTEITKAACGAQPKTLADARDILVRIHSMAMIAGGHLEGATAAAPTHTPDRAAAPRPPLPARPAAQPHTLASAPSAAEFAATAVRPSAPAASPAAPIIDLPAAPLTDADYLAKYSELTGAQRTAFFHANAGAIQRAYDRTRRSKWGPRE